MCVMKKIWILILSLSVFSSVFATGNCSDKKFDDIKSKATQMEKAWDAADLKKVVSFYDNDFIYMGDGKLYTDKQDVLKHYVDGFSTAADGKKNMGKIKLNYQYCREIDEKHQLVVLEFVWNSPSGKVVKGHDLLLWKKDSKNGNKIIVDFPQQ